MSGSLLLPRPINPFKPVSFDIQGREAPAADVIREYTELRNDVDHAGSLLYSTKKNS